MTITITNASDKILFCCQFILRSQKNEKNCLCHQDLCYSNRPETKHQLLETSAGALVD